MLASTYDPTDLCLLSKWDCRHVVTMLGFSFVFVFICEGYFSPVWKIELDSYSYRTDRNRSINIGVNTALVIALRLFFFLLAFKIAFHYLWACIVSVRNQL
jgi:hypothetical protein